MPDTMAEKHVTSDIASARNLWYLNKSVFWLAQMTLYVIEYGLGQQFKHYPLQLGPTVWLFTNHIWNNCILLTGQHIAFLNLFRIPENNKNYQITFR